MSMRSDVERQILKQHQPDQLMAGWTEQLCFHSHQNGNTHIVRDADEQPETRLYMDQPVSWIIFHQVNEQTSKCTSAAALNGQAGV